MMLTRIISQRKYKTAPSFASVFEWEDIIAAEYPLKLEEESKLIKKIYGGIDKFGLTNIFHFLVFLRKNKSIRFIMKTETRKTCVLNKNVIPVIIDFWLTKNELKDFYIAYRHCPLILISSAEVYEYLLKHNCPLNIAHWPLSISDKYKLDKEKIFSKVYDFCLIGRPNPFFKKMLDLYEIDNPDFVYVLSKGTEKNREYITNKGEYIGKDTGRRSYLEMIQKTKITCYSTPGIDQAKNAANNFNQVTPRLFEMIAGGCYVIGQYPDNSDTNYYQLKGSIPNVHNYDEFKDILDFYRVADNQNLNTCELFLNRHYTSIRAKMLRSILTGF